MVCFLRLLVHCQCCQVGVEFPSAGNSSWPLRLPLVPWARLLSLYPSPRLLTHLWCSAVSMWLLCPQAGTRLIALAPGALGDLGGAEPFLENHIPSVSFATPSLLILLQSPLSLIWPWTLKRLHKPDPGEASSQWAQPSLSTVTFIAPLACSSDLQSGFQL